MTNLAAFLTRDKKDLIVGIDYDKAEVWLCSGVIVTGNDKVDAWFAQGVLLGAMS